MSFITLNLNTHNHNLSNPTNCPKDMIQVYYVSFYFTNPLNSFYISHFSFTADDPVAQGMMAATQRDFPNFTGILHTSDDANKNNNRKKCQKDVLNIFD